MEEQEEIELIVDDYDKAVLFLKTVGAIMNGVQETKRELWKYQDVEITLDTWPFLDTMIEIEGNNKESVQEISRLFGFDWKDARFASADFFYAEKFGITIEEMYTQSELRFGMKNPFIK